MVSSLPEIRVRATMYDRDEPSFIPDDPGNPARGGTKLVTPLFASESGRFAVTAERGRGRFDVVHVPSGRRVPVRLLVDGVWVRLPGAEEGLVSPGFRTKSAAKRIAQALDGAGVLGGNRLPSDTELEELKVWAGGVDGITREAFK